MSPSDNVRLESSVWLASRVLPGVRYRIGRMSLSARIALTRRVREIGRAVEFLEASDTTEGRLDAAIARGEVDRAYLQWGLKEIDGLLVDGRPATPMDVEESAPLDFAHEVLASIRHECGLQEDERKN